jgi:hypothetical protein
LVFTLFACGDDSGPVPDAAAPRDGGPRADGATDAAMPLVDAGSCDDENPCTVDSIGATGACVNTPGNAGTECRGATADCDVAETCTGADAACPADAFAAETVECRASAGDCDAPEACTGASADCPADSFAPATTECRASAGDCDAAESCTGASATCPTDAFAPATTECRASAGDCDAAESCTGASAACPADAFAPATTECRASAGDCDAAESCTGASAACPADAFAPATTECRAASDDCDAPEACTGAGIECPTDVLAAAGTACRAAAGLCDAVEQCDGIVAACPADELLPAATVCRPVTSACDTAESCSGTAAACPADVPAGRLLATTGGATSSGLYVLDRATGATLSTLGPTGGYAITGLAQHPTTGVLYGATTPMSPTSPQSLVTLNTTTGAATVVASLGGITVADISFASDGTLYGWAEFTGDDPIDDLATIHLTTGALAIVGESGLSTFGSGLAFAAGGTLYFAGLGSDGEYHTVTRATGAPTVVGTLTGSGEPVSALAFDNTGTLYGVENVLGSFSNLVVIDPATGALTVRGTTAFQRLDGIAFVCP